jgi:sec1 family domain-containing protein 1
VLATVFRYVEPENKAKHFDTKMDSTLKSAQLNAIYRMLSFNEDCDSIESESATTQVPQWKILIYDVACRSIISPILSVQQLRRRCGVTLHLLLHSDREPIPDVPAVYFVQPTKENLVRIAQDASKAMYSAMYLNFVTKLDRTLMEEFAQLVVQTNSLSQIASIHDQYLDFTCYEQSLFTLNKSNSYVIYNGTQSTEAVIEQFMTHIAYSLFSVVATLGQVPIIRCPKVRSRFRLIIIGYRHLHYIVALTIFSINGRVVLRRW